MSRSLRRLALTVVALAMIPYCAGAEAPKRPNILLILADDLGWRDVGYHGSEIQTPNIDRISRDGVELDRFYAQPSCSPTRAALMTGKSPLRLGIDRPISKNERTGLPLDEKILPQFLSDLGYQTAMVGKWHLGHATSERMPLARGFEHFYGSVTGGVGYWDHNHGGGHDWQRNGETVREEGYTTRLLAKEALRLIDDVDDVRPLFLYAAFHAPHLPNEAPIETIERYREITNEKRRVHAAMVEELDDAIGLVLSALESRGMLADTLVVFASDNGGATPSAFSSGAQRVVELLDGWFGRPLPIGGLELLAVNVQDGGSDNSPLPKGKGSVAEGGSRVPAAIWWPGRLEAGRYDGFITVSDLLPTILEGIGAGDTIPSNLDGRSQWGALLGRSGAETPDYVTSGLEGLAVYRPPWKLIDPDEPRLHHIYDDPFEDRDIAAQHPGVVAELVATARSWPRGAALDRSLFEIFWDPDSFGGPEDRAPWADVARERAPSAH